ncbi:MAG TPA: phosphoglycerate dehydrogenase [Candidatus Butyricicoccus stercorigallinarum]|nr:phosphoglycerate dehydrogenase [Candidatus Butyricicoccus stercorigallinarum]
MYQVKLFNNISQAGTSLLAPETYAYSDSFDDYDAILVRSAKLHDLEFPKRLKCIARAGAGVNNIPLDKCTENGIVVFNTPGANANAVKELVLCALLLSSRDIVGGANWARTLAGNGDAIGAMAEKGKSHFAGCEIAGKTLGVIGLGAIGIKVANAALALGMEVIGYDPYLSVDAALQLQRGVRYTKELHDIFTESDYITVHVPLTDATRGIVDAEALAMMKDGVRILNFARDGLCDQQAVIDGLESGKIAAYCCDFASEAMLAQPHALCLPHLGASTAESEDNCAVMAAQEIMDYLENGTIRNSVNFPNLKVPREAKTRICIMHRNMPNLIAELSSTLAQHGINIENMGSRPRGEIAYTIMDTESDLTEEIKAALKAVNGVIKFRIIQ